MPNPISGYFASQRQGLGGARTNPNDLLALLGLTTGATPPAAPGVGGSNVYHPAFGLGGATPPGSDAGGPLNSQQLQQAVQQAFASLRPQAGSDAGSSSNPNGPGPVWDGDFSDWVMNLVKNGGPVALAGLPWAKDGKLGSITDLIPAVGDQLQSWWNGPGWTDNRDKARANADQYILDIPGFTKGPDGKPLPNGGHTNSSYNPNAGGADTSGSTVNDTFGGGRGSYGQEVANIGGLAGNNVNGMVVPDSGPILMPNNDWTIEDTERAMADAGSNGGNDWSGSDFNSGDSGMGGFYAHGGVVKKGIPGTGNPPGPDNKVIAAKTGERVVSTADLKKLGGGSVAKGNKALDRMIKSAVSKMGAAK